MIKHYRLRKRLKEYKFLLEVESLMKAYNHMTLANEIASLKVKKFLEIKELIFKYIVNQKDQ